MKQLVGLSGEEALASKTLRVLSRRNAAVHKALLNHDVVPSLLRLAADDSSIGQVNAIYTLGNVVAVGTTESFKDAHAQIRAHLVQSVLSAQDAEVADASLVALALLLLNDPNLDKAAVSAIFHALACLVGGTLFLSSLAHTALCCAIFAAFRLQKSRELLLKEGLLARLPPLVAILANKVKLGEDHASLWHGTEQIVALGGKADATLDPAEPSMPLRMPPPKGKEEVTAAAGGNPEDGYTWTTLQVPEGSSGTCPECSQPLRGDCVRVVDSGAVLHDGCFCCKVCADGFDDEGRYWVLKGRYVCKQHRRAK